MRKVVERTAKRYGSDVLFFHGHIHEIAVELKQRSDSAKYREQKYPCIMMLEDFRETHSTGKPWDMEADVQVLIVAGSDMNYTSDERIEKVFKPVLYPICDAFISALKGSSRILSVPSSNLRYLKIDRHKCTSAFLREVSYANESTKSQNTAALLADHLDAIELNLNLKLMELEDC
ncbi:MAG: hypothetical protein LBK58_12355 [Prevotellaceae bacterium]|jgi:hypothetical protein|nr:hypothetical protein [Prevotellaceae bacterium]